MNRTRTLDPQDTAARIRETQERVRREGFGFMICDRVEWDKAPIEFRRMAAQQVIRERLGGSWAWTERDGIQCAEHPVLGYFVFLPGFWTQIGSPENEEGRYSDEGPMYRIYVEPFFMGMHNVTEGVWDRVNVLSSTQSMLPKTMISWLDSKAWMEKASAIAGVEITFPWEEEWEGACRAGSTTPYFWGTDPALADQYAWHAGNSGGRVHEVGELKPNVWGLYDMIGNVWEWCRDEWTPDHSAKAATADGVAKARMAAAAAKFSLRSQAIRVEPNAQSASRVALRSKEDHGTTKILDLAIRSSVEQKVLEQADHTASQSTSNAHSASRLAPRPQEREDSVAGRCHGQQTDGDTEQARYLHTSTGLEAASPSTSNALEAKEDALREGVGIAGRTEHTIGHLSERQFSLTPNAPGSHSGSQSTSNAESASRFCLPSSAEDAETGLAHRGDCRDTPKDQSSRRTLASESPSTCNSVEVHSRSFSKGHRLGSCPRSAYRTNGVFNQTMSFDSFRLVIHI